MRLRSKTWNWTSHVYYIRVSVHIEATINSGLYDISCNHYSIVVPHVILPAGSARSFSMMLALRSLVGPIRANLSRNNPKTAVKSLTAYHTSSMCIRICILHVDLRSMTEKRWPCGVTVSLVCLRKRTAFVKLLQYTIYFHAMMK